MAYDTSESARDNFGKFIDQFQLEIKTPIKKLERILKLYRQNLFLLFNQTSLHERLLPNNNNNTHTHTHTYIYIYIYIYICVCVCVCVCVCIYGGARGVMVIVVGNEHGDTSSIPGQD